MTDLYGRRLRISIGFYDRYDLVDVDGQYIWDRTLQFSRDVIPLLRGGYDMVVDLRDVIEADSSAFGGLVVAN
jgi:hypothetical protein